MLAIPAIVAISAILAVLRYSVLNATLGSTRIARRAGT
jgi:hypothetical protein